MIRPLVTVVVPSLNQAEFLDYALASIFKQDLPVEVYVMDGGSVDSSVDIIRKWEGRLTGWRSHPDAGQAAAINEGIALGEATYVCWLNSDDYFLPGGLKAMIDELSKDMTVPAVYGRAWNINQATGKRSSIWVEPFNERRLAVRCIISQPATLIRRDAWDTIGGLNPSLNYAMDYDLWWRLFKAVGSLKFMDKYIAVNREHNGTKTKNFRRLHNNESVGIVKKYNGRVPIKWLLYKPYSVWFRSIFK